MIASVIRTTTFALLRLPELKAARRWKGARQTRTTVAVAIACRERADKVLPFLLRRFGFDPASASAPFVATLVDVTGIVIYFSVAATLLGAALA